MEVKAISQGGQIASNTAQNSNSVENSSKQISTTTGNENQNVHLTEKQVQNVVNNLNKLVGENNSHVEYEIHKGLGNIAIKIVDNFTNEVKWQVPAERVVKAMDDLYNSIGLMFDKKG